MSDELEQLMPAMNVNMPEQQPTDNLVPDELLMGLYSEVMNNLREDRQEISGLLTNFVDMVINDGDSTSASKEAVVNLLKIKSDTADKMAKILDLMTRIKLRDRNTMPAYLAKQENKITINSDSTSKRELIKQIHKIQKQKKEETNAQ